MITPFKQFIVESEAFGKLLHLEHAEDHVFHGHDGYRKAVESLHAVNDRLHGRATSAKITTKYDGSMSTVFGHDPKTSKFFVGTKGALSQSPKLNYTKEDIRKHYSEKPEVVRLLNHALEHLPKVAPKKGIYQGDFMYTKDHVQEGPKHYHFTPNTIMYSAEKNGPEGAKIKHAKVGFVVHTKYHGQDMEHMHAGFEPDMASFTKHKDVHLIDPEINVEKPLKDNTEAAFRKHIGAAETEMDSAHPHTFNETVGHTQHLKHYINHTVRTDEVPSPSGFKTHLTKKYEQEADKLKTPAGKLRKKDQLLSHLKHVDEHHDKYQTLLNVHNHLQKAKNVLVKALEVNSPYEHSIDGKPTGPEGFVVIHNGHPTKLVNRAEFSKANFARHTKPK